MAKRSLASSSTSEFSLSPSSTSMVSAKRRRVNQSEPRVAHRRSFISTVFDFLTPWRTRSETFQDMDTKDDANHVVAKIYPALPAPPPQLAFSPSTSEPPLPAPIHAKTDAPTADGYDPDNQQISQDLATESNSSSGLGESSAAPFQQVSQGLGTNEVEDGSVPEDVGLSEDQPIELVDSEEEETEPVDNVQRADVESFSGVTEMEAGPSRANRMSSSRRRALLRPTIPTRGEIPQRTYTWERSDSDVQPSATPRIAKIINRKERAIRSRSTLNGKHQRSRKVVEAVHKIKRFFNGPTRLEEKAYIATGATVGPESKDALSRLIQEKLGKPTLDTSIRIPTNSYQPASTALTTSKAKSLIQQSRSQELEDILQDLRLSKEKADAEAAARLRPTIPTKLKDDEEREVDEALRDQSFRRMSAAAEVTAKSMRRLRPNIWLDDEIINYYGGLLTERSKADTTGKLPKMFYCSSFFFPKMEAGYNKSLSRWTKKVKVFELDLLVMPINLGNSHWTASAINIKEKRVEYYDSMGDYSRAAPKIFRTIKTWLEAEHQDKLGEPLDTSDWVLNYSDDTPQQDNGNDCGIFSCQTIEALTRGKDLSKGEWEFSAKDMPFFRRLMAYEIAKGELYKRW